LNERIENQLSFCFKGEKMKVYISADMEGLNGTTHWDETDRKHADYGEFREQMTAEVVAACEGALEAGATEIWVKDAHDSARNIIAAKLPTVVKLLRGWSGHPYMMVDGLDATFQAFLMVGYHSRAGSTANPLAHTMSGSPAYVKINGDYASELTIHSYIAALENVPVAFVSGDAGLCEDASLFIPGITTVAVKQGKGSATLNIHPQVAIHQIREGVRSALSGDLGRCRLALPTHFAVEIRYKDQAQAYRASFFPGASLKNPFTIQFESGNYFDVLRLFAFVF
jgi:D-amino peptidase